MHILKLVTFDVVGTLINFKIKPSKVYTDAAATFGIFADQKVVESNFKLIFKEMSLNHPNFGQATGIGWETWWHDLVVKVLKDSVNREQHKEKKFSKIAHHLISMYKTKDCYILADGAEDLLLYLKQANVKMGVISNFDERLHSVLKSIGLYKYFDFVISSFEAGVEKPSPEIFRKALEAISYNISEKEALHVGNKIEYDYLGAVGAGWNAALIAPDLNDSFLAKAQKEGISVAHIFQNFPQLKDYVILKVER